MGKNRSHTPYSQHFLHDEKLADRIVKQLSDQYRNILEIGPGPGILTQFIKQKDYEQLYLVELDETIAQQLKEQFPQLASHIYIADILELDWKKEFSAPLAVIGNFPYQISAPLIFKILDCRQQVQEVVGMFQLEVAQRLAAAPNNKTYGITSVFTQTFYEVELCFKVGKGAFHPPPQVTSAVIYMRRNEREKLPCSEKWWRKIVKSTFQHRRKMLRNTLKPWLSSPVKKALEGKLTQRPEALSVEDFIEITSVIERHQT